MTDDERPLADDPDLVCGNRVEILVDGPETYAAMFQAIDAAARSVHVVAYQVDDSEVGRALGTRLTRSAAAGADVCLMIDDFGSLETDSDMLEELAADGVRVRRFNPLSDVVGDTDANRRNHRKLMVIDGQVAFVGGVNFDERYQRSPTTGESADLAGDSPERPWRDTHLRIEGPAVSDFQQAFLADWNDNGDDGDYDDAEPANGAPEPAGNDSVRLATAGDQRASMTIYESYLRAFLKARRRIWITQAYFAPDRRFLRTLTRAAKSGVDVRLVLPGHSDSRAMIAAARSYYSALLRAGARVFERRNVLLHAKTALIDDYWVTIGSSNLDNRSFSFNRELNAVVVSSRVASAMERLFLDDVARSDEIDATEWRRRPLLQRAAQRIARSARRWL